MIGRRDTSIVKWVTCKIILVISQNKLIFVNLTEHMLFSVRYFNGKYVIWY